MKRPIQILTTAIGALALLAVFMPTDASAQRSVRKACNGHQHRAAHANHGRSYRAPAYAHQRRSPVRYHSTVRRAPVRRYYTSPRVITHPHYGGPIYYRNSSLYVRPTTRYYAPSAGYSYGYSSRRSSGYCR